MVEFYLTKHKDIVTKMEEVIGEENTDTLFNFFFYELPEEFWEYVREEGQLKETLEYLWGIFFWNLDKLNSWIEYYSAMETDGLTYWTNPIWSYLFGNLNGVEPLVYEEFESFDLNAEELCDKIDAEVEDAYDVCMWWFALGVAHYAYEHNVIEEALDLID